MSIVPDWILILAMYAGPLAAGDSVALVRVEMYSEVGCENAGKKAQTTFATMYKAVKYVCVNR